METDLLRICKGVVIAQNIIYIPLLEIKLLVKGLNSENWLKIMFTSGIILVNCKERERLR